MFRTTKKHFNQADEDLMFKSLEQALQLHGISNILLIAHRGMGPSNILGPTYEHDIFPENSLRSFRQAILLGADGIELDIFRSKDNQIMVIHDDELWKNVYTIDRDGSILPTGESQETFRVRAKTQNELQEYPIGPYSEDIIPNLIQVFELVMEANQIRSKVSSKPVILNIELKDPDIAPFCLDLIQDFMRQHPDSGIHFDSICFCSFKHQALIHLKTLADQRRILNIQIAPGIKTATLFGAENVDKANKFKVKDGSLYKPEGLSELKELVTRYGFTAYDAVLWEIYNPLIQLAKDGNRQIHASTSDYRNYDIPHYLAWFLYRMSQEVTVYFKCDEVESARQRLLVKIPLAIEREQERRRLRLGVESILDQHMPKPDTHPDPSHWPVLGDEGTLASTFTPAHSVARQRAIAETVEQSTKPDLVTAANPI